MRVTAGWRALVVSIGAAFLLLFVLRILFKDWTRAAILCSLFLILFFSYGHVYGFLEKNPILGIPLGRHRTLLPLWLALAAAVSWWVTRRLRSPALVLQTLQWIGLAALVFPVLQFISFEVRLATANKAAIQLAAGTTGLHYNGGSIPPNIYYIILDAYARDDVLKKELAFDNSAFLKDLEAIGFTIPRCSQSNYAQTELSLASSMNFDYLQSLDSSFVPGNKDRSHLWPMIRQGKVRRILEENGYTMVAFETGFSWSEWRDADVFFSPEKLGLAGIEALGGISEFEVMLIKTTAGLVVSDAGTLLPKALTPDLHKAQARKYERILYVLSKLKSSQSSVRSPKFVFVHLVAPHGPYVLGPNGEQVFYPDQIDRDTYLRAYTGQVEFLNHRISDLVSEIIRVSSTPPVVILQADHGHDRADSESRMKILNAYYLPGGGDALLYPSISPVNTFRVIFNDYFGADFPLLEDASYFSTYKDPYNFIEIPNTAEGCLGQ